MATVNQINKQLLPIPFKTDNFTTKSRGVTFGIQSTKSIPQELVPAPIQSKQIDTQPSLPVNFFHSPGEYNKMLIKGSFGDKISSVDRQMGVLRSLEFINDPIFEKQKQKRNQRLREYQKKIRQQSSIKAHSQISKCVCCCCEDFCEDCATNTLCQRSQSHEHSAITQGNRLKNLLIDIEGMKRGDNKKNKKQKKIYLNEDIEFQQKRSSSKYRIEQLINNTLIKSIQEKRNKQLIKLIKQQHSNAVINFNQSVRLHNRCASASKTKSKISVKPSKSQLRQAYWYSIKDLIAYELKKDNSLRKNKNQNSKIIQECHKRSNEHNLSPQKMDKLRASRGKKAYDAIIEAKQKKKAIIMDKNIKLLKIKDKQTQIIKKCNLHKFKPSPQMIETAFAKLS